jgi:branched-chain amino acid transport system substrate-binding protein
MAPSEPILGISRREFLKDAVLVAGATGLMGPLAACGNQPGAPAESSPKASRPTGTPIKVGAMYIMSGALATYGTFAKQGLDLAVDQINDGGGVLGRPITATVDDEGNVQNAIRTARRLALEDKVDFLLGLDSSGVAEAVVPIVPELKKILMITHAATPKATGSGCNKYVFRCSVNVPQNSAAGARIAAPLKHRKWTTIGPDYAFGHQSWEYFQAELKKLQPDAQFLPTSQQAFPKLGNDDFNSFISKVLDAKPDAIWISTWGGDLVTLVKQGRQQGLWNIPAFMELGAAMEVLETLGSEMPINIWVGTRYWFEEPKTKRNKDFVDAFFKKYNHYPSYNAQNAYTGLTFLVEAIKKAGSADTDAVGKALEGMTLDVPQGSTTIRKEDHQAVVNVTWGKTAASSKYKFRVLDPFRVLPASEVTPPVSETGCRMTA